MLELFSLILKNRGYQVVGAHGGELGLRLMSEDVPDLVLLDLMMPDMSGWDVYQHMKADDQLREIPVIVVTARAHNIDKVLGIQVARVQDYVTKPFSPEDLLGSVERVLQAADEK